jgi:hypothetical protein
MFFSCYVSNVLKNDFKSEASPLDHKPRRLSRSLPLPGAFDAEI